MCVLNKMEAQSCLTHWSHEHSAILWLTAGFDVVLPFRHSTVVDTRVSGFDFIQLQNKCVRCWTLDTHFVSHELTPRLSDSLLIHTDDVPEHSCGRGRRLVLPGDREPTFDPLHFTAECQPVTFFDTDCRLHFDWETAFCRETRRTHGVLNTNRGQNPRVTPVMCVTWSLWANLLTDLWLRCWPAGRFVIFEHFLSWKRHRGLSPQAMPDKYILLCPQFWQAAIWDGNVCPQSSPPWALLLSLCHCIQAQQTERL